MLTETSIQRLRKCRCELYQSTTLAAMIGCSCADAKSLMMLTNNVFYTKTRRNYRVLVVRKNDLLGVITDIVRQGGEIPEKRDLEYPRNLICIVYKGEVPSDLRESDVLKAVSLLGEKQKFVIEGLYRYRYNRASLVKELHEGAEVFRFLEDSAFQDLGRLLKEPEFMERKGVRILELDLPLRLKRCLMRAEYSWSEEVFRDLRENRKAIEAIPCIGQKGLKELQQLAENAK